MHRIIIILFFVSVAICSIAQESDTYQSAKFKFAIETPVYLSDIQGNILNDSLFVAPSASTFIVVGKSKDDADKVVIRFLSLPENYTSDSSAIYISEIQNNYQYFVLESNELANKTLSLYSQKASFTTGMLIVPIKFRLSPYEFSKDFMIGTTVGVNWRLNKLKPDNYLNLIASFGLSHLSISDSELSSDDNTPTHHPAFSTGIAVLLEINNLQYGVFLGLDYISQNDKYQWSRQGQPWVSAGLGIAFLRQDAVNRQNDARAKVRGHFRSK